MAFENRYSLLDRTIHRIAFNTRGAQLALNDVEDLLFSKQFAACMSGPPVFITSLPRAGTTLLLECFAELDEFASHCYRDMPFVLMPLLWSRITRRHFNADEKRERAHGDGVAINVDSPEAFEEVVWKAFWKKHYLKDRILPWGNNPNANFSEFYRAHMQKIACLRRGPQAGTRYLSKNNANIARLGLLRRMFPDAPIVIPFRDPLQHAVSLLRQHRNFIELQTADPFALEYMTSIGHHDFGQDLRPIDFDGWLDRATSKSPAELGYWIEYWIAAFRCLLSAKDVQPIFVSYERLCASPAAAIASLGDTVQAADRAALLERAETIHAPAARTPDVAGLPQSLLDAAEQVHAELIEASIC